MKRFEVSLTTPPSFFTAVHHFLLSAKQPGMHRTVRSARYLPSQHHCGCCGHTNDHKSLIFFAPVPLRQSPEEL